MSKISHSPPKYLVTKQEVRQIPANEYPVIIVEDFPSRDFLYVTREELAEKLLSLYKTEEEDHPYCMYFIFSKDYFTTTPGEDCLGKTNHHHVNNCEINDLMKTGLKVRSAGDIGGIYECRQCRKMVSGALSAKGYVLPSGWQIYLEPYEDEPLQYRTFCSEWCKKKYLS